MDTTFVLALVFFSLAWIGWNTLEVAWDEEPKYAIPTALISIGFLLAGFHFVFEYGRDYFPA